MLRRPSPLSIAEDICDVSFPLITNDQKDRTQQREHDYRSQYLFSSCKRAEYVRGQLKSSRVDFSDENFLVELCNVMRQNIVWGSDRPHFIVSAHLDHIAGLGAVDNASGLAAVLSVAHELRSTRARVMYVCFDSEEEGRLGSENFVKRRIQKYSKGAFNCLQAVLNIDSIGKGQMVDFTHDSLSVHPIPVAHLLNHATDATSFTDLLHVRRSSLMTLQADTALTSEVTNFITPAETRRWSVANQDHDMPDQLDENNLERAVEMTARLISNWPTRLP